METDKTNTESPKSTAMNGMPEWVMHLLTGLGAMGADFLLFIKPLQDKFEAQNTQIKQQEKRIEDLEYKLEAVSRKLEKKEQFRDNRRDDDDDDLFNPKRKSGSESRSQRPNYAKL